MMGSDSYMGMRNAAVMLALVLASGCSGPNSRARAVDADAPAAESVDSVPQIHILDRYPTGPAWVALVQGTPMRLVDSLFQAGDHRGVLALGDKLQASASVETPLTGGAKKALCIAFHQLADAAMRVHGTVAAASMLRSTLGTLEKRTGPRDSLEVEVSALLAQVLDLSGDTEASARQYDAAAAQMLELGHDLRGGDLLVAGGLIHWDLGDATAAAEHYRRAEQLFAGEPGMDTSRFAYARLRQIDLRSDSAKAILDKVQALLPRMDDLLVVGYYHNIRGYVLSMSGRNLEAYNQLLLAVQTLDTLPKKTHYQAARLAAYLTNTAYCAKKAGMWERCIELASLAVEVYEQVLSTGDPYLARDANDGLVTILEGYPVSETIAQRYGDQLDRSRWALNHRLARTPQQPALIAKNYRNLASEFQAFDGEMADSILKYADLCLQWPAGAEAVSAQQLRGFALAHQGRTEEALHALADALGHHVDGGTFQWTELDTVRFVSHVRAVEVMDDIARVLEILERKGLVHDQRLLERFTFRQHQLTDSLFQVEGVDHPRLIRVRKAMADRIIDTQWPAEGEELAMNAKDALLAWMDDDKAMLFRRERFLMTERAQQAHRQQLYQLKERKEGLLAAGKSETDPNVLHTSLRIDSLQQLLATMHISGPAPDPPSDAVGRSIRMALPQGTGLMIYRLLDDGVLGAFVTRDNIELLRKERNDRINEALARFSSAQGVGSIEPSALDDLAGLLPSSLGRAGIRELIIVPDGVLSHLPFELLPMPMANMLPSGNQLIDGVNVHYALSAGSLMQQAPEPPTEELEVFAFAPDYRQGLAEGAAVRSSNVLLSKDQLRNAGPLVHNQAEADGIARIVRTETFTGSVAEDEQLKPMLGANGVLHFAMHAFSSQEPMRSGLVVRSSAITDGTVRGDGSVSIENDGVLHAFELLTRPVRAPLVVLSACETGQGKHQDGEGVRSLARSFMLAGARSTVASLWKVDDEATKEIMVKFYEKLAEGLGKADALAEAKRWYRRTYPNEPASKWAAFILIGDNEPVRLKKRSPIRSWIWGAGVLVVLAGGAFLWQRSRLVAA